MTLSQFNLKAQRGPSFMRVVRAAHEAACIVAGYDPDEAGMRTGGVSAKRTLRSGMRSLARPWTAFSDLVQVAVRAIDATMDKVLKDPS